MNGSGAQAYQPYNRARRIEYNALLRASLRENPRYFLPTPQAIYNPARLIYPDSSTPQSIGKVTDREYWLSMCIQNLPKAWLQHLKTPLLPSPTGFRCFQLYPLKRHQAILSKWNTTHPGECYPCEVRWNLNHLKGNVDDDCPPPYYFLTLIAAAINGSPDARATNKEIRLALMLRYNHLITRSTLCEEVDLTLNHYKLYFKSSHRQPTASDDGDFWALTDAVARVIADTIRTLPPPQPLEPSVRLNYSKELDPGRTIVTGPAREYSDPDQVRPGRLDVDEIKTARSHLSREQMDAFMIERGKNALQEWGANN